MEKLFSEDNTIGYTPAELDALNREWEEKSKGMESWTDEYHEAAKAFCDEVAGR